MNKIPMLLCLLALAAPLQARQILFEDDFSSFSAAQWEFVSPEKWQVELLDGNPALHLKTPQPDCSGDCNEFARTKDREFDDFILDVDIRIENTTYQNYFIQFGGGYYLQFQFEGVKLYRGDPFGGQGGLFYETPNNYVTPGVTYHITLIRELPRIRLLINGQEEFSIEDSFFPTGAIDIGSYKGTVWIDNVVISQPVVTTPSVFSEDFENGTAFWQPLTPSRWQIIEDEDDLSYAIITSTYTSPGNQLLGEYSLLSGKIFQDFEFSCSVRIDPQEVFNDFADIALIFAWQDSLNYAYVMLNRRANETMLYRVSAGVREPLLPVRDYYVFSLKRISVMLRKTGDLIQLFVDGSLIFQATVPGLQPGQLGIGSYNDAARFDDIIIRNAPASADTTTWLDTFSDGTTGNWRSLSAEWQPEIHFDNGMLAVDNPSVNKTLISFSPADGPADFSALTFSGRIRLFGERYLSGAGEAGVRFCINDESYYELTFNFDRFATRLRRVSGGVSTDIANILYSGIHIDDEEWHEFDILRYGNRIEVYLDHRRLFYTIDTTLSGGTFALFASNTSAWFDNLFISPYAAIPKRAAAAFLLESISGDRGDTLIVPLYATIYPDLKETTLVLRYDDSVVRFLGAEPGADAGNFSFDPRGPDAPIVVPDIPGAPSAKVLHFTGGGSSAKFPRKAEIARLSFLLDGAVDAVTPLIIGPATTLRDGHEAVHFASGLLFNNGSIHIARDPIRLSGTITYFSGSRPMANITVEAATEGVQTQTVSNNAGSFILPKLDVDNWTIRPKTTAKAPDALSTEDASLLLRWLGHAEELQAGQLLAADATGDGAVLGSDVMAVLRFLAGFPTFTGLSSEFGFDPVEVTISSPGRHELSFTAFVRGDVDGSYSGSAGKQGEAAAILLTEIQEDDEGLHLSVLSREPVRGFRSKFLFNAADWHPLRTQVSEHFRAAIRDNQSGEITVAAAAAGYADAGAVLFTITLRLVRADARADFSLVENAVNGQKHADILPAHSPSRPQPLPENFYLSQSRPNPFSISRGNEITIELHIPDGAAGRQSLELYDILGRRVHAFDLGEVHPGIQRINWNGRTRSGHLLPPGIYFYFWRTADFTARRKLLIIH